MDALFALLSSDAMNQTPVQGLSWGFILIFFAPMGLVAGVFFLYGLFSRRSILRAARVLSLLWVFACVPAALMILMGYAFNSSGMNPLIIIPVWVGIGLVALWVPVWLRRLFGVKPV